MSVSLASSIVLRVHGVPAPQGSKTAYIRSGRAIVTEGGSASGRASHAAWRQAVATAARDYQQVRERPLLDEPVALDVTFRMPKPRSTPKYRRWPQTKPDADKLLRSVMDSLTGVLLADDARVVKVTLEKVFGDPPGATIILTPLGWQETRS
jgi:crossover junction endodeoxyribonuclease RusA